MHERLLHALDLGMFGDWETAKRTLENLDDPLVPRLISLMTQQQRCERDRCEAQALARHELGNALLERVETADLLRHVVDPFAHPVHRLDEANPAERFRNALKRLLALLGEPRDHVFLNRRFGHIGNIPRPPVGKQSRRV